MVSYTCKVLGDCFGIFLEMHNVLELGYNYEYVKVA
jgi:hypothetical protein